MLPAATRPTVGTDNARPAPTLYLAFELGNRDWKLGFTTGFGQPSVSQIGHAATPVQMPSRLQ